MGIMGLNVFSDIHTTMLSPIKLLKLLFPEILRHDMLVQLYVKILILFHEARPEAFNLKPSWSSCSQYTNFSQA